MNAGAIRVSLRKELRALLPVWSAAAAVIVLGGLLAPTYRAFDLLMPAAFLAFTLGTAALGGLAAGQDHLFGTIPLSLSIPVERRQILLTKLAVLVPLILSLAAAFAWAVTRLPPSREFDAGAFTIAVLFATICLAPWLTVASRNLLAGTLFPLAIISVTLIAANLIAEYGYQLSGHASDVVRRSIFSWTVTVACVAGAPLSWRAFTRMEAIEGSGAAIDLSWRLGRRRQDTAIQSRPRSIGGRLWLLAAKELHVQQLSFVLAVVFTMGWAMLSAFYGRWIVFGDDFPIASAATLLYFGGIAILAGSLSSAEERQYGVLTTQALLPMSTRAQFAVKAVVTLVVSVVLAFALPLALVYRPQGRSGTFFLLTLGTGVVATTAIAMYASSLAASGVRAVAWSLGACFAVLTYGQWVGWRVLAASFPKHPAPYLPYYWAASVAAVLVLLAYRNHREGYTSGGSVVAQLAAIAAFIPGSLLALTLV